MTNSANVLETIFNLEILLNFSVKVLRFTQTNKNTENNTKITLREGPKIYVLKSFFPVKFPQNLRNHQNFN